jgi:hypothetical protein
VVFEVVGPIKFCCAGMCRQWGGLLGFGVRDCPASTNRTVNLFADHPQANGRSVLELTEIQFCPWCGEVVETVREK